MPASVVPITGRRQGVYVLLDAVLPGRAARTIGVLLVEPGSGRGWVRLLDRFDHLADSDDAEVLEALEPDLRSRVAEDGAEALLEWLEDRCSNVLRVSER